jgi:hypothetical protein
MDMTDETWHLVKSTPKVTGSSAARRCGPTPISDKEVANILHQVQEGVEKPKPKVLFEVGESVRVTEGPFTDFNGNVEEVNYEKSKIRVSVLIFGRATPVELDFGQVEKASPRTTFRGASEPRVGGSASDGEAPQRRPLAPEGEARGKEDRRPDQASGAGGQGESVAAHRTRARPARPQHHGILQGVQRADAEDGTGPDAAGRHHGVRGQELHVHPQVAARLGADPQGAQARQGQPKPHTDKVGKLTRKQAEEIAKMKQPDLTAADLDAAVRTIAGSARSMGVEVEGI